MKNKLNLLLVLVVFVFLALGCTPKSETGVRQFSSSNAALNSANQVSSPPKLPKSNTAVVISLHANLREKDDSSSAVLEVVPQDASVEVIKQQGAWFLVKTETNQGWMHGNTLKLQNYDKKLSAVPAPPPRVAPKSTIETNDIDATAKCRDDSLSYSASRRGTCSHHGGVAVWY